MSELAGVEVLNVNVWPCEGLGFKRISSKCAHGVMQLANTFCVVFVVYQPLRSQKELHLPF